MPGDPVSPPLRHLDSSIEAIQEDIVPAHSGCIRLAEIDGNFDVTADNPGIWKCLMGGIHQRLGHIALQAWQAELQVGLQEIEAISATQIDLCVDGQIGR